MTPAPPLTVRAGRVVRAVVVVDSPAHHVAMCVRSVEASVARAGITVCGVEIVRPDGTSRELHDTTTRDADLLVVLRSSSLVSDELIPVAVDLLSASPTDWVFPELVGDLVSGMSDRVIRIDDTARTPSARWDVVDGVRHPRCLVLADDGASAVDWAARIEADSWPLTVLDHLADGHQLRVARDTMVLLRSADDLAELDVPDRARIVALADHKMFASETWSDRPRSTHDGGAGRDGLGRALHSARRARLSGVLERRGVVGARAAVRGAMNEWSRAVATAPPTLAGVAGLRESVARLNDIDPQVHPMVLKSLVPAPGTRSWTAEHFHRFLDQFGERSFTDVFVRPTFPVGGVENVMLDIASALASVGATSLVVATDASASPLQSRIELMDGVDLWAIGADPRNVPHADVAHLIGLVLARSAPRTLSVCDSERGFRAWFHSRTELRRAGTRLIYHDYSLPKLDDVPYEHVASAPAALMDAAVVVTDSMAHQRYLTKIYGLQQDRFLLVPHPVAQPAREKESGPTRRVLWAGRLSPEKCPETAIEAVGALAARGIEMDMYGPIDDRHAEDVGLEGLLARHPNVTYCGAYSSLDELDFDRYDLMLIPSVQEGLPHAAIEAVFANLYLVVAAVGGLPEAVEARMTGVVVDEATPQAFADAIAEFYDDATRHDPLTRRHANGRLRAWHTRDTFDQVVLAGYRPGNDVMV